MKEIWRDIKGYEKIYKISNTGKIKRVEKNKELKQALNKRNGYLYINLSGNGMNKVIRVHRLVAEAIYKANQEAINSIKLQLRLLESQIQREYGN